MTYYYLEIRARDGSRHRHLRLFLEETICPADESYVMVTEGVTTTVQSLCVDPGHGELTVRINCRSITVNDGASADELTTGSKVIGWQSLTPSGRWE